jgi:hypothetical protein
VPRRGAPKATQQIADYREAHYLQASTDNVVVVLHLGGTRNFCATTKDGIGGLLDVNTNRFFVRCMEHAAQLTAAQTNFREWYQHVQCTNGANACVALAPLRRLLSTAGDAPHTRLFVADGPVVVEEDGAQVDRVRTRPTWGRSQLSPWTKA